MTTTPRLANVFVTISIAILLSACGGTDDVTEGQTTTGMDSLEQSLREKRVKRVCEKSVKQQLKDPDSAQFREETARPDTPLGLKWLVTGEVNARNSFGGMVGFTAFTCVATYDADSGDTQGEASILSR